MKRLFTATLLITCAIALTTPRTFGKDKTDESEQIKKIEQEWIDAYMKGDATALARIEADDFVLNDPTGATVSKADDLQDLKSGAYKWTDFKFEDMKVRIYGKTAIATGVAKIKGSFKGQDATGRYRFTDVFVRKKDEWRAVSTQLTAVTEKK